ncbi:MAG: hypothetical protein EPN93_02735 [Spirochaetes bacterium]|nr:MAG: hypothetical protein EPN93_02735 [Spirochaetota bacterium]
MKDREKELLISISGAMRDFAHGSLPLGQARERYRELRDRYRSLGVRTPDHAGSSVFKSLCYDHNITNFSLLSGALRLIEDKPEFLFFSGDAAIASAVKERIPMHSVELQKGIACTLAPGDAARFPHAVHCSEPFTAGGTPVIFTAVTSSKYFGFNRFLGYSGLVRKILEEVRVETGAMHFDCRKPGRDEIHDFMDSALRGGGVVTARCFYFGLIDRIFSHLGIPIILEISEQIVRDITGHAVRGGKVFPLSVREYIALLPEEPDLSRKPGRGPVEFRYKGVSIPYEYIEIPVRSMPDRIAFWEHLARFVDEHAASAQ